MSKPSILTSLVPIAALACASLLACGQDVPLLEPERPTVRALWDPTTSTLPTPSDLVRNPTTGALALPITDDLSPAEQELRTWLNTLDGYPITSTLTIPVSAPVTALGGAVALSDAQGARLSVSSVYDARLSSVVVTPRQALAPGTHTFGLWGYEGGARGVDGAALVADAGFYFVRGEHDLRDHPSAAPGGTRAARVATADMLEEVRRGYARVFSQLSSFGLDRSVLASAGSFTVTSRPSLWIDPTSGRVPVPNNLLLDRATGRVSLPAREDDDEERADAKRALSAYDGFSTTGPMVFESTEPVDPSDVADPKNLRVFRVLEGDRVEEITDLERGVLQDGHSFWVRPRLALDDATDHVVVARRALRGVTTGRPHESQPLAAMLRGRAPVSVGGNSQLGALDDSTALAVEASRVEVDVVLRHLEAVEGLERGEVAMAVPFRTVSAASWLMDWRAKLYEEDVRTDMVNVTESTPSSRGLLLAMPSVRTIVSGQITTIDHLDPRTRRFRTDGQSTERLIDFIATVPRSASPGTPIPTVLFGHGLATSRELVYLIAERLARAGFAVITVDLPYHGRRSVCLKDGDCKRGACSAQGQCLLSSGAAGELESFKSPFPDGPVYPVTSGDPFIDMHDIVGSRDHFVQAVIDLCQLRRVIRGADFAKASGGYVLDGEDVVYLGMSLGGILGATLTVVEPSIQTYVLNVPGGSMVDLVENSGAFDTLYAEALLEREITSRDSDAYFEFTNGLSWVTDPIDPINILWRAVRSPLTYIDPETGDARQTPIKRVLIQMAEGDSVVPNISTKLMSERAGIPYRTYTPTISNHAFLFDPTSGEGRRARNDMVEFFEAR